MKPIYVTKSFLAPYEEYAVYDKKSFESGLLTNQGPLVLELEEKLKNYLNVDHFHYVNNGTIAIQLALDALGIKSGEIITTPFSYVATASAILWERCTPVFCDIEPANFTIDASKIEALITPQTRAILPVNVFGYVCEFNKIDEIAKKYNLKVIYDSAHSFGAKYNGRSVFSYGDASTCSFHATKLFQTREGGSVILKAKEDSDKLELNKRFGHHYDDFSILGINGKNCESNAAMGLANFPYIEKIIDTRKLAVNKYDEILQGFIQRPSVQEGLEYNYAYYPAVFDTEKQMNEVLDELANYKIYPRRYFYPSLNKLPYLETSQDCPISEDIASRILCLPLWAEMDLNVVEKIANIIKNKIGNQR